MTQQGPRLLRVAQVVDGYGVSRRTIERWRRQGAPFMKVGEIVLVAPQELDAWLRTRSCRPAPSPAPADDPPRRGPGRPRKAGGQWAGR